VSGAVGEETALALGAVEDFELVANDVRPVDEVPEADAWPRLTAWRERLEALVQPQDGGRALAWIWAGGSMAVLALSAARVRRFRLALALAGEAPAGLVERVAKLSFRVGLAQPPEVVTVPGGVSPMVWGLPGRPMLVVPADLWESLDDAQRATLLVHELAHLRRRDHWVRWLEVAVSVLYWWLPPVWWARRQLRAAEERCCDAWVVWTLPDDVRAYAETLIETVVYLSDARSEAPSWASGIGGSSQLKRRLIVILRGGVPRCLGRGGVVAAFGLSAVLLPWSPTLAQKVEAKDEPNKVAVIVKSVDDAEPGRILVHAPGQLIVDQADGAAAGIVDFFGDDVQVLTEDEVGEDGASEKGVKDALDKLKAELDAIVSKAGKDAGENAQAVAIKKAIAALESARAGGKGSKTLKRVLITTRTQTKTDDSGSVKKEGVKAEDEAKQRAEIEKLTVEVKTSSEAVHEAGRRLAEAQKRLAEANMKLAKVKGVLLPKAVTLRDGKVTEYVVRQPFVKGPVVTTQPKGAAFAFSARAPEKPDQEKRLAELEKKLDEVLSQLKALKDKGDAK
jgi:beta-lactamase regulating signal transducer with metallopeptidase domain